jgi:hypothetical protein
MNTQNLPKTLSEIIPDHKDTLKCERCYESFQAGEVALAPAKKISFHQFTPVLVFVFVSLLDGKWRLTKSYSAPTEKDLIGACPKCGRKHHFGFDF